MLTKLKPSPGQGHADAIVHGISRIGFMKGGGKALWEDENIADSITAKAIQFIENHKTTPFFLYVGTNDVHVPRYPHERFRNKSGLGYRGDAILQFDWTVGEIVKALKEAGVYENTLIVLTSDNGPVVDDGYCDKSVELLGDRTPGGVLRGGKYSNFEAGTRVPFIVSWPGQIKPDVTDALFSHIDLFASMEKLVGQDLGTDAGVDSEDYLKTLLGKDKKGRDFVIEFSASLSVYDGEWKYITPNSQSAYDRLTNIELGNSKEDQLYHLSKDISERHNLAKQYPDKVKAFQQVIEGVKNKIK